MLRTILFLLFSAVLVLQPDVASATMFTKPVPKQSYSYQVGGYGGTYFQPRYPRPACTTQICSSSSGWGYEVHFSKIAEVRVSSGQYIDSIEVIYTDRSTCSRSWSTGRKGGRGGTLKVFRLACDEYITGFAARGGKYVDAFGVATNKGRTMAWGGRGGGQIYRLYAPAGQEINGFHGRAGQFVDALGVMYQTK